VAFFRSPDEGAAAATHRHRLLTPQLRRTGSRRDWRWTAEELDETPQVLRGCSEQHLVLYSAQAAQPKSIELQDALHVGKSHLDLLAFAARLLERLVLASARTRSRTSSSMSRVDGVDFGATASSCCGGQKQPP
jgi:hypothetical protein